MFSKPLNIVAVYILTVINFAILILPFLIAIFPFMEIHGHNIVLNSYISFNPKRALIFLLFLVSFLMLVYLFFDFIFGFSIRTALKDSKRYDKIDGYEFLGDIFNQVKTRFDERGVKLYVRSSDEINAFAVGSLGRKVIVLTKGLINYYADNTESREEFLIALRSVLGHEMSHLVNKDFLPGLIIIVNQKVTNFVANLMRKLFLWVTRILFFMRINGFYVTVAMRWLQSTSDNILTFFNRHIIYNIYEFLRKFASRSIEYRADKQSAQAFGGANMAFALSLLGESGYFTLFSTHPATQRRVKKVQEVKETKSAVSSSVFSIVAYYLSLMFLILICLVCGKLARVDTMFSKYILKNYEPLYHKLHAIMAWGQKFMIF